MINRVRDAIRNFKPQGQVSFEEWEQITDRAAYAKKFMSPVNPVFVELQSQLQELETDIMENKLREVRNFDFNAYTGVVQRVFVTPKKLQDDETIGQIKFLRQFFAKLQSWIDIKKDYEQKEADGLLVIDRDGRR